MFFFSRKASKIGKKEAIALLSTRERKHSFQVYSQASGGWPDTCLRRTAISGLPLVSGLTLSLM